MKELKAITLLEEKFKREIALLQKQFDYNRFKLAQKHIMDKNILIDTSRRLGRSRVRC